MPADEDDLSTFDEGTASKYSDEQLSAIARDILQDKEKRDNKNTTHFGVAAANDWNDDEFISEMYEQYLRTVQRNADVKSFDKQLDTKSEQHAAQLQDIANVKKSTFEQYLRLCLEQLDYRRKELKLQRDAREIDQRVYSNALQLADMSTGAIRKYLERNPTKRLIGV